MLQNKLTNLQNDTTAELSLKTVKVHRLPVKKDTSSVKLSRAGFEAVCMDCYFFQPNRGCIIHRTLSITYNSEICNNFEEYN